MQCPKCQSTSVSIQEQDSDGTKTVVGIGSGGVRSSAGVTNKNHIVFHCASCDHVFPHPVETTQSASAIARYQEQEDQDRWLISFYKAIEVGDVASAERILEKEEPYLLARYGVQGTYKWLKGSDRSAQLTVGVLTAIGVGLLSFLISRLLR